MQDSGLHTLKKVFVLAGVSLRGNDFYKKIQDYILFEAKVRAL